MSTTLSKKEINSLLRTLKSRFENHLERHKEIKWEDLLERLTSNPDKLVTLHKMETTGGEPDVVEYDNETDTYVFVDCAVDSPKGRRSLCYDQEALEARQKSKPRSNVIDVAKEIGIELLTAEQYRELQSICQMDTKTSSWLKTPEKVRKLGGAIFGDFRYDQVFIYHNSAKSFYISRGFRGLVRI
ncbi:DUF4256 domain-containing protein [Brumimicrobium aurantiacum]|uniref:DUF4256 domain-containing protein n=1 Tax=Brumimicrobium aurantiacum TaxID=1737063 RepID=A0A3E1F254_9FLAO|nr:DUF4256 domain-containing protein [Brumimicrobium aurantiacum]RFC55901.1 DUF4256 domain-containing protein [Brumimicrobium aurantiacum]